MGKKLTFEAVKELILQKGFEPLFNIENYKNTRQVLSIKCLNCDHIQEKKIVYFTKKRKISCICWDRKLTFEQLKDSINSKGFEPCFTSEEYKNNNQKVPIKCLKCGHIQNKLISNLRKKNKNVACDNCHPFHEVRKIAEHLEENMKIKGFKPLFDVKEYKNHKQIFPVKCLECGHVQNKIIGNFKLKGIVSCEKCRPTNLTFEQMQESIIKQDFKPLFKKEECVNNRQRLSVQCLKCGHVQDRTITDFRVKNRNITCKKCYTTKLTFEQIKDSIIKQDFKPLFSEEECQKNNNNIKLFYPVQCKKCNHIQKKKIIHFRLSNKNIKCNKCENRKLSFEKINESLKKQNFEPLFKEEEYLNCRQLLLVRCLNCNHIQEKIIHYFRKLNCNTSCEKCGCSSSSEEKQVVNFISELNLEFITQDRHLKKELDIYIPSHNFAIEYNGLYWHREDKVGNLYHYNKTALCKEKDIRLFHIFSDEWLNKQEIVKSMLKQRLGLIDVKISARKCQIKQITTQESKQFFEANHIDDYTRSEANFGLFYNNNLVMAVSLRKPFHKKYTGSIELARMATKLNIVVVGGFSKLLKEVKKYASEQGYKAIITYADLRFGEGNVYSRNSFEKQPFNKTLNYWYTDGLQRFNRFKFKAQNGLTEKQVAEQNKVSKIYGCGNNFFTLNLV